MTEFEEFKGRALLIGTDAEFYFDREQFNNLRNTPLEGEFEDMNKGWNFDKFTLAFEDFRDNGDGIRAEPNPETNIVEVKLNENALTYLKERGEWGSRWMMSDKIKFSIGNCPFLTKEKMETLEKKWKI
ncbi:MAG: hypothetical protein JXA43_02870 [Candidatus Diapherotrites archaeon]|nr:hypothetical protein [Candidatus Diapherotrites archaeon]